MAIKEALLSELASRHGFALIGTLSADDVDLDLDAEYLQSWQESGFAGTMGYMNRSPKLFTDLKNFLPSVKSVISLAVPYSSYPACELRENHGRVARYALGRDYHKIIPKKLNLLVDDLSQELPTLERRIFTDAVPLLERALARRAGIGFVGKNTMLIRPKLGSYFFLAEILLNREVQGSVFPLVEQSCGTCTRCIAQCPTKAFEDEYVLNAQKCISYLTIEKRGDLALHEREMLGEWVFGCDRCQEVCPFNHSSHKGAERRDFFEEFLRPEHIDGMLDLNVVLDLRSECDFRKMFAGTPLMRTKREGLLRNASCVAACLGYDNLIPKLSLLAREDPNEVIRSHCSWAIAKLQGHC